MSDAAAVPPRGPSMINIRNLSVKCGRCNQYQVLVGFKPLDPEWNLYTFECGEDPCAVDPSMTRTLVEVPSDLDEFARRNPRWHGGKKHAGAEHGHGHDHEPPQTHEHGEGEAAQSADQGG